MEKQKIRKTIGWIAVGISAVFANFWAYWGINENFHEGWYFEKLQDNLVLMFGQYLLMPIGFMLLSFISIRWNKIGSVMFGLLAVSSYFLFGTLSSGFLLVSLPLAGLGLLYWFGKLEGRKFAYLLVVGLPMLLILSIGTYYMVKVTQRYNDNQFGAKIIQGNEVCLMWAPQGPGWPDNGTSWYEAQKICAHLSIDGSKLEKDEVNVWRLPNVNEAVGSMVCHGANAGGTWNSKTKKASYKHPPDKESPMWDLHRKTIYWWTSTESDSLNAFIIVYNGGVWPRRKTLKADYLNFRAVKDLKHNSMIR